MAKYKYPYCPKEYYPALMYACKLVRDYGVNNAIGIASNTYRVDADILEKHFRARQAAGQKGKSRPYKWFVVVGYKDEIVPHYDVNYVASWDYNETDFLKKSYKNLFKGLSLKNIKSRLRAFDDNFCGDFIEVIHAEEYKTEAEAKARLDAITVDDYLVWLRERKESEECPTNRP